MATVMQDLGEDPPEGGSPLTHPSPSARGANAIHRYGGFDPADDDDDDDLRGSQVGSCPSHPSHAFPHA